MRKRLRISYINISHHRDNHGVFDRQYRSLLTGELYESPSAASLAARKVLSKLDDEIMSVDDKNTYRRELTSVVLSAAEYNGIETLRYDLTEQKRLGDD